MTPGRTLSHPAAWTSRDLYSLHAGFAVFECFRVRVISAFLPESLGHVETGLAVYDCTADRTGCCNVHFVNTIVVFSNQRSASLPAVWKGSKLPLSFVSGHMSTAQVMACS